MLRENIILNSSKKDQGFTLIELLVVIVLIGILSGMILGVINIGGIRTKARDSQRMSDLKKIQTALALYFNDNRQYPSFGSWVSVSSLQTSLVGGGHISVLPTDPLNVASVGAGPCTAGSIGYWYRGGGGSYVVATNMELVTSVGGSSCNKLRNWISSFCSAYQSDCYGVEEPF